MGFKGKAEYCDVRDNSQERISFQVSPNGAYFEVWKDSEPNEPIKFVPLLDGLQVVGLNAKYSNGDFIANFTLDSKLNGGQSENESISQVKPRAFVSLGSVEDFPSLPST